MPTNFSFSRSAGLICAAVVIPAGALWAADSAATPVTSDAFPSSESYIKISGVAPFVSGDHAAFDSHTQIPAAGAGGIEDLYVTKDLSDSVTVIGDGHAMGGSDDYLAHLNLSVANVGSVDVGYKRFRTFYDGVGGFFPLSDQFQKFSPESLHVDRGAFWVELKLARPDAPVFTFSYRNETRNGMKDSTEWAPEISPAAVVVNGTLVGNAAPANTPYTAPNAMILDERHQIVSAAMAAKVKTTEETLKVTVDTVNNIDSRSYVRYPHSNVIADPTVVVTDDLESRVSTSFRVTNLTETKLSTKLAVETGLTYNHLSSTNGGYWITPTYSATANAVYAAQTASNIYGGSKFDDYVGNIGLKYTPTPNWLADLAFRDEYNAVGSNGGFTTTSLASTATTVSAANVTTANDLTYSHYSDHIATPEVSLQYLGFKQLSLYANFDDRIDRGDQHWINPYALITTTGAGVVTTATAPISSVFFQDANQDNRDVKVGANWNACNWFTFRAEVYRKDHVNRFIGANDIIGTASYGALYVTGYTFTGVKLSAIVKPSSTVTFTTRYQPQRGNMSTLGNTITGGLGNEITSGKVVGQMISETVDWTPATRVYFQANLNLVYNYIQTAYPVVVVSATTNIATPIQNANNNYVTASGLCGFVLDKRTDAQFRVYDSQANNYNPQIAAGGQPYGASFRDEGATAGLTRKLTERLVGEAKVGYLHRTDDTTGGFTNYRGPLVYLALTYSL